MLICSECSHENDDTRDSCEECGNTLYHMAEPDLRRSMRAAGGSVRTSDSRRSASRSIGKRDGESLDEITVEVIPDVFPGAVNIANLLRAAAWIVVTGFMLGGIVVGGAIGRESSAIGALGGALTGAVIGGLAGALYASGSFAIAYILLLLNEIEQNTRVTASGNTLGE